MNRHKTLTINVNVYWLVLCPRTDYSRKKLSILAQKMKFSDNVLDLVARGGIQYLAGRHNKQNRSKKHATTPTTQCVTIVDAAGIDNGAF